MTNIIDINSEALADLLGEVEPARLKGLKLLWRLQPAAGAWFPTDLDAEELAEATAEMIDYVGACGAARQRLGRVGPTPLTAASVRTFAL